MAGLITDDVRAAAEIYVGDEICQKKTKEFLKEKELPNGLLPLQDIEECGMVEQTGFVWLRQKKKTTHRFAKINKLVSYETLITATVEPRKFKKVTGVKTKELMIWLSVVDISVDEKSPDQIVFKIPSGLYKTFGVSNFQIEEDDSQVAAVIGDGEAGKPKHV